MLWCMPMSTEVAVTKGPGSTKVATAAAATAATAALACGVCCVLPIAIPAIALTSAGAVLAWFGTIHRSVTLIAVAMVALGWLWVWVESARSNRRAAARTLWTMGIATAALLVAVSWPWIEPGIIAAVRR